MKSVPLKETYLSERLGLITVTAETYGKDWHPVYTYGPDHNQNVNVLSNDRFASEGDAVAWGLAHVKKKFAAAS